MNSLHLSIIEAEAHIHRSAFPHKWTVFAGSLMWAKLKRNMNFIEVNHFRKCWESNDE